MTSNWLKSVEQELKQNPTNRHQSKIEQLAGWIAEQHKNGKKAKLNFICTHNSRRSQFSQTWCDFAQRYLNLDVAESYSGGTEVTACNERTIQALERAGLTVNTEGTENPVYTLTDGKLNGEVKLWSKVYDDDANPSGEFAAVMTCDHADANCPFIPGVAIRVPLTYTDPKYSDGTDEEAEAYDRTCKIIATDMLRLFKQVQTLL
jgi:arsenate reductase (thioredoxin)